MKGRKNKKQMSLTLLLEMKELFQREAAFACRTVLGPGLVWHCTLVVSVYRLNMFAVYLVICMYQMLTALYGGLARQDRIQCENNEVVLFNGFRHQSEL